MVLAMTIVTLFLGASASLIQKQTSDQQLTFDSDLRNYIRDTRDIGFSEQSAYFIHFTDTKVWRSKSPIIDKEKAEFALDVPPASQLYIQLNNKWTTISKNDSASCLFSRSGISEPCTIRFLLDGSDFEYELHPLTSLPVYDAAE